MLAVCVARLKPIGLSRHGHGSLLRVAVKYKSLSTDIFKDNSENGPLVVPFGWSSVVLLLQRPDFNARAR